MAQQRADALALIAETAKHDDLETGAPGEHYQVVVMSTRRPWPILTSPAESVLEDGRTFPRKGLAAWRAASRS